MGDRPRGPILGAREEAAPTSPPVARTYTCGQNRSERTLVCGCMCVGRRPQGPRCPIHRIDTGIRSTAGCQRRAKGAARPACPSSPAEEGRCRTLRCSYVIIHAQEVTASCRRAAGRQAKSGCSLTSIISLGSNLGGMAAASPNRLPRERTEAGWARRLGRHAALAQQPAFSALARYLCTSQPPGAINSDRQP